MSLLISYLEKKGIDLILGHYFIKINWYLLIAITNICSIPSLVLKYTLYKLNKYIKEKFLKLGQNLSRSNTE